MIDMRMNIPSAGIGAGKGLALARCYPAPFDTDVLSRLERTVVALAVDEARRGICPPYGGSWPRLKRMVDLLLGRRSATALANARLDRLYRLAHAAARGGEKLTEFSEMPDEGAVKSGGIARIRCDKSVQPALNSRQFPNCSILEEGLKSAAHG